MKSIPRSTQTTLYDKVAAGIRTITPRDRREIWACNLVTLYVSKGDGSERVLLNRLGVESLVYPLRLSEPSAKAMVVREKQTVKELYRQAKRALDHSTPNAESNRSGGQRQPPDNTPLAGEELWQGLFLNLAMCSMCGRP